MMVILKRFLIQQFNFAKLPHFAMSPLTPTLSRLRARGLKPKHIGAFVQNTTFFRLLAEWFKSRTIATIPSPAGGRGCPTGRVRGKLLIAQRLNHAK